MQPGWRLAAFDGVDTRDEPRHDGIESFLQSVDLSYALPQ
jgi:hypothetical protein